MIEYPLFLKFVVSILLGALIGLQRERFHKTEGHDLFGGIRSFILIAFLGTLSMYLSDTVHYLYGIIITAGFLFFMVTVYRKRAEITKMMGGVTEIVAFITFIIGMICYFGKGIYGGTTQLAVALTILMLIVVSTKHWSHKFAKNIDYKELITTIKFAVIAFVVLPLLPNQTYGPFDVFNPYNTWLMVVLISAISYVGYVLNRFFSARKSVGLTGILGGLVSSTAVTSAMSIDSKKKVVLSRVLAAATVAASTMMFFRIIIEVTVVNRELLPLLMIPIPIMATIGIIGTGILFRGGGGEKVDDEIKFDSPFQLMPAIKFGLFYLVVLFISKVASMYLPDSGLVLTGIIAGLADVDAITLSMASLSQAGVAGAISQKLAVVVITVAAMTNMLVKFGIAFLFGARKYAKYVGIVFGLIFILGLVSLMFL